MSSSFRSVARVMVALAIASLGACTLGLDGLSGGIPDRGSAPDGSTADVTTSAIDAATDALTPADGGVSCPGQPDAIFCDPFDTPTLEAWWTVTASSGGTIALVDASVVATIPIVSTSGEGEATLTTSFAPVLDGTFHAQVDFYVDSTGNRGTYLDGVTLDDGVHTVDIEIFDRSDGAKFESDIHLDDGGFATTEYPLPMLPAQTWVRATIAIDYTVPASPTFSFALANPPDAAPTTLVDRAALAWPYTPTHAAFGIGTSDVNEPIGTAWRVLFDNAVITKP